MAEESIYKLLSSTMLLGNPNNLFNDYYMLNSEKLIGHSVSIVMEIDELLNKGYTKEEITSLIMRCNYTIIDQDLTEEEGECLRNYSLRMLDIRYKLYFEEKGCFEEIYSESSKKDNATKSLKKKDK